MNLEMKERIEIIDKRVFQLLNLIKITIEEVADLLEERKKIIIITDD